MDLLGSPRRALLAASVLVLGSVQLHSCSSASDGGGATSVAGSGGAWAGSGGARGSGGASSAHGSGGVSSSSTSGASTTASGGGAGGASSASSNGAGGRGGGTGSAGQWSGASGAAGAAGSSRSASTSEGAGGSSDHDAAAGSGGASVPTSGAPQDAGASSGFVVAIAESSKSQAADITQDEIRTMVADVVDKAGGLDFIQAGQTVVLKPNLLVATGLSALVNGITTDWRVTKAVAELVRAKVGASGKILVMEGSTQSTTEAYSTLGYTAENFGTDVDEFIALEGSSCNDRSQTGLVQKPGASGKSYWVNERYFKADALISLPVMKTHSQAGVTGAVKNLGIGGTPASQYATSGCSRDQTTLVPHGTAETLGAFIRDFYSVRPADFVVMDALQGVQHGPYPAWTGGNYSTDKMNMRLVLAAKNAVALDTVEATVMNCNPKKVPYLTLLETDGVGTTDLAKITVLGKQVSEVAKSFAGPSFACPGT